LKPIKGAVKNSQVALNDSAVVEDVNVARVDSITEGTGFRTGPITWNTLPILSLKQIYICTNKNVIMNY
jgi:hypothetical protein